MFFKKTKLLSSRTSATFTNMFRTEKISLCWEKKSKPRCDEEISMFKAKFTWFYFLVIVISLGIIFLDPTVLCCTQFFRLSAILFGIQKTFKKHVRGEFLVWFSRVPQLKWNEARSRESVDLGEAKLNLWGRSVEL